MSVPAKESITFTMGPTTWKIEKGAVGDVWSVEITCPQFKYPRFEFLLQKRCSGMNISDIIKQVAARLMCVNDKFHEDYLVLFEIIREKASLFDIPTEFLDELREKREKLGWFTVTPWIKEDYEFVLKELHQLGLNVEFAENTEHIQTTTDWYIFSPQDRPVWIPARIPQSWTQMGNLDDMENQPFCSLEFVLNDLTRALRRQRRDLDDLKQITVEEKPSKDKKNL